jgi:hypothetical protein
VFVKNAADERLLQKESPGVETQGLLVKALISSFFYDGRSY